jgi:hypothetical protein
LKGLTDKELFDLSRSIGNNKSGYNPLLKPMEVAKLLGKAKDNGASTKEIAIFLKEKSNIKTIASGQTMVTRTINLFKRLDPSLHEHVVYKTFSSVDKDSNSAISFQSAVELTRFKREDQKKIFETIVENSFSKEDIKTLLHLVTKANISIIKAADEIQKNKGNSNYQTIVQEINLENMNTKLYSLKQQERDSAFSIILSNVLNFKFKEIHLGIFTYSFTLSQENKVIPQLEIKKIIEEINKEIINYE